MKINPPSYVTFTFGKDKEELYNQAEFLLVYYTARLKMLKAENANLYTTAEQAPEETFYKDMISACMLFIQEKNTKPNINHEATTRPSETFPRDIPPGKCE